VSSVPQRCVSVSQYPFCPGIQLIAATDFNDLKPLTAIFNFSGTIPMMCVCTLGFVGCGELLLALVSTVINAEWCGAHDRSLLSHDTGSHAK
jgi:hypothetical protein